MNYTVEIFNRLDTYEYLTFKETKTEYLRRKLPMYTIYEFINKNLPENAVVYDVLCGQRSYYVDREYLHDQRDTDTYFYNYTAEGKPSSAYTEYLGSLRSSHGESVTHLLIKPQLFVNSFKKIFYDEKDHEGVGNNGKLKNFIDFLNSQRFMFHADGAVLYELMQ
jgi:hypothetical protein